MDHVKQIAIRVPESIRRRLKLAAVTRGESMQNIVQAAIDRYLSENESAQATRPAAASKASPARVRRPKVSSEGGAS